MDATTQSATTNVTAEKCHGLGNQQGSRYTSKREYRKHGKDVNHPDFPHGVFAGYRAGCRCEKCVQANRELKREYTRKLRATNPDYAQKQRDDKAAFRATEQGAALHRSMNARRKQRVRETRCNHDLLRLIYLHCPAGYEVDHIVALSRGGEHAPANLQYLPKNINAKKHARIDFDCNAYLIRWQDVVPEPSTTIPQGSRAKRPEVPGDQS